MPPRTPSTQFRIFALPLVRLPRPNPTKNSTPAPTSSSNDTPKLPNPLILFHVSQPPPPAPSPIDIKDPSTHIKPASTPAVQATPIYQRGLNKATEQWLKLGDKPKDGWMYWFYAKGEGLMDKIEYEEWALKSVQEGLGVRIAKDGEKQDMTQIPLLFPTLKDQPLPALIPKLHRLLMHRIPYHKKMMIRSLIFTPVTFPFAIIPVLPNFPMFYVLWRAYSHWKAYRGATYLEQLLKLGLIVETPSKDLDSIYASVKSGSSGRENHAPDETTSKGVKIGESTSPSGAASGIKGSEGEIPAQAKGEAKTAPDGTATPASMVYEPKSTSTTRSTSTVSSTSPKSTHSTGLLLTLNEVPEIAKMFGLRQTEIMDVNRAVEQAAKRIQAAEGEAK